VKLEEDEMGNDQEFLQKEILLFMKKTFSLDDSDFEKMTAIRSNRSRALSSTS